MTMPPVVLAAGFEPAFPDYRSGPLPLRHAKVLPPYPLLTKLRIHLNNPTKNAIIGSYLQCNDQDDEHKIQQ